MRDYVVVAIFALSLPLALRRPFVGLVLYFWISLMNPHRYSWGFAYDLPLAMVAAAVTLVSVLLNIKEARFPRTTETYLFLSLWAFITLSTAFSLYPNEAWQVWELVSKIFLMTFVTMLIITTKERLVYFTLAVIGFIGFVGVKGSIFGILTGGQYRIWGPRESFLADNNSMGLALVMVAPLCFFAKDLMERKWQYLALLGTGLSLVISAVLTYSRGALVGLVGVGGLYIMRSRHKTLVAISSLIIVVVGLSVLPSRWFERMGTIQTYQEDDSANQRINSWIFSYNLARARFLGGGFDCFRLELYDVYSPRPELGRVRTPDGAVVGATAHSIYFEMLAMHGFVGLALYLSILVITLVSLHRLNRISRWLPGGRWVGSLSRGYTVSIIGFMISGAFLSRAFFDLFWAIFAMTVCLKRIVYCGILEQFAGSGATSAEREVATTSSQMTYW